MKQTAVEWLRNKLFDEWGIGISDNVIEQAKAMEKEQIEKSFSDGQETPINHPTLPHYSREEYYNETFGGL